MVFQRNLNFIKITFSYFLFSFLTFFLATDIFSQEAPSTDISLGCLPYYQLTVNEESFFNKFRKPFPLIKMKYLLFSVLPQVDKKLQLKGEQIWEELSALGLIKNVEERGYLVKLIQPANDLKIFCPGRNGRANGKYNLWTFPQLIESLPQLHDLVGKALSVRENYLLLQLQENHRKNIQLQEKFKTFLQELLKEDRPSSLLNKSEIIKIEQFGKDQRDLSENLIKLREFYRKLPGDYFQKNYPRWEKLFFSIAPIAFNQIANAWVNVKNYTKQLKLAQENLKTNSQIRDLPYPNLGLLSLNNIEKGGQSPWEKIQNSGDVFQNSFNNHLKSLRANWFV